MPFEVMDLRDVSTTSDLFHEISIPSERQIGFWNSKTKPDHHGIDGMLRGPENTPLSSKTSWRFMEESSSTIFSKMDQPSPFRGDGNVAEINRIQRESSLFSSSFSEAYIQKLTSSGNDLFLKSADCAVSNLTQDKPIQPLKEIEAQTIEYLLPDEDDLFSGVTDELGFTPNPNGGGNLDDYDIFGSGGGLELDSGNLSWPVQRNSEYTEGTTRGQEQHSKQNFSAPNTFSSQWRPASATNPYAVDLSCYSHNRMNFGLHGTIGSQGTENRHIPELGLNGHPRNLSGGGFGSLGKKSCPLHGESYGWSNSNSYQYHPPSPMKWHNLPSLINGVQIHHQPQHSGYPKAGSTMQNYSVETSRSVNSSKWDRRIAYTHETSGFHLGSLGNTGFPAMSPLTSFENACQNISSLGGGNCNVFTGRNPVMSVPTSFDSPNERVRFRRKDINSNNGDRKQFELDIDCILLGEDCRTTLMLKNIPNKYTSKMLLASIDEHHQGTYDFIYLPIDFKNKCNVGYAFINMIDPFQIVPFYKNFNGKKWEKFNSEKVASIAYARIQGKTALVTHFQNSSLMNEDKRCRPILFHTDGPNAGDQEPFPMGTNIRARYGKSRVFCGDEQGSPFTTTTTTTTTTSANGEDEETDSSSGSKDLTVGDF